MGEYEKFNPEVEYELPESEIEQLIDISARLRSYAALDSHNRATLPPLPERDYSSIGSPNDDTDMEDEKDPLKVIAAGFNQAFHKKAEIDDQYLQKHGALMRQYHETSEPILQQSTEWLESLPLWQHVFTTDNQQGALNQSIYFMTPHGASLRLKTSKLLRDGMSGVIQPISDRILFYDRDQAIVNHQHSDFLRLKEKLGGALIDCFPMDAASLEPQNDYHVAEYLSHLMHLEQDMEEVDPKYENSHVKVQVQDNFYLILCNYLRGEHRGHAVNNIVR